MKKGKKTLFLALFPLAMVFLIACLPSKIAYAGGPGDYEIHIKVKGVADTSLVVAYYYGDKQYVNDTFAVDSKGELIMKGTDTLEGGIYMVVLPDNKGFFEFIVTEKFFTLETELSDPVGKMKVKNSEENTVFYEYLRYMEVKKKEAEVLRAIKARNENNEDSVKYVTEKLNGLDKEVETFKNNMITSKPNAFISKVMAATRPPVPGDAPAGLDSAEAKNWKFYEYRKLFFKEVDFSDNRLLRTPVLHQKAFEYLDKLTPQHPDSLLKATDVIMKLAEKDPEVFKYFCIQITNKFAKSSLMCFDKVYWHMVDLYYITGKASWTDSTQMEKIKDRYYKLKYNLCGSRAVNMTLPDTLQKMHSLNDIKAEYTVLYFWDYDCGNCKKTTPKLLEFYHKWKAKGVEVFGICTRQELDKWKKYIKDNNLDWINGIDPENKSNFRVYYDIYSTPVIFLLDKNKNILGKRFEVESLEQFLENDLKFREKPH